MTFAHVTILLYSTQGVAEYLVALKKLTIPVPSDINSQLRKKMTSPRRKELYQRPKTSGFDFVFPCAFENKHRFENFFVLIIEGIDTL